MKRLILIAVLLLVVVPAFTPQAKAFDVVPCGWYCYYSSGGDMAECIGEGAFRRRGSMADCETRRDCMPTSYSGEQCTSYCVGSNCYDV